jgi:hypothetical protein
MRLTGREVSDCPQNVHDPEKEKACYLLGSRLSTTDAVYLVGRGRLELPTNGLKVRCSTN